MRFGLTLLAAIALPLAVAHADVASDRAAAITVYPVIVVSSDDAIDTVVQISNTSTEAVRAHCFYVSAAGFCSTTGDVCFTSRDCNSGQCIPRWVETDFWIGLTPDQPLAWTASEGLAKLPIDGIFLRGTDGTYNEGRVPPLNDPFLGELKCVVVDDEGRPTDQNVLVGSATSVQSGILAQTTTQILDITRFNAIGIQAVPGANDGDGNLILGEEYEPCPDVLVMDHFFDGATDPVSSLTVTSALALVPCSQDFRFQDQNLTRVTAQFLVFNEFEQRLSTSIPVECYSMLPLSHIDTQQANRSIFHVAVAGTLTGQTRIRGVGNNGRGLLGAYFDLHGSRSSATNLHIQGRSPQTDLIRLP